MDGQAVVDQKPGIGAARSLGVSGRAGPESGGGAAADVVTGNIPCASICLELGVYLLGALEPASRAVVDRHLLACSSCRAELSGLAALPSLLRRVPADVARQLLGESRAEVMPGPPLMPLLALGNGYPAPRKASRRRRCSIYRGRCGIRGSVVP